MQLFPAGAGLETDEEAGTILGENDRAAMRELTRALLTRHRRRGVASFLHVSEGNAGARRLYESMGFVTRAVLPMCKVERDGAAAPGITNWRA